MKLKDSRILVTGGSSGIGKATASLLAKSGGKVAITGREKSPFPVVITTEFGNAPMDEGLFAFFQQHSGSWAHVTATTHMRAGVIRPEVIIMSGTSAPEGE